MRAEHPQGVHLPRQNYRHMKKQKEESRKARQAEKRQRRLMRTSDASPVAADTASSVPRVDGRAEDVKTD